MKMQIKKIKVNVSFSPPNIYFTKEDKDPHVSQMGFNTDEAYIIMDFLEKKLKTQISKSSPTYYPGYGDRSSIISAYIPPEEVEELVLNKYKLK